MEIDIDYLAEFLFLRNTSNSLVELTLDGIEDNKDFFFFCLDLFCKGLVLLYGKDNKIVINDIDEEQFESVRKKLENAGILAKLTVHTLPPLSPDSVFPNVNIAELKELPANLDIDSYVFKIDMNPQLAYNITFQLIHKV
jgi:hypothetical protein